MYKSGLILGGMTLLIAAVVTAGVGPLCTPCFVLFLGLAAGYATSLFDKPPSSSSASRRGAISGAIAGIGAVLGLGIGSAINGIAVGPERALQLTQPLIQSLGFPTMSSPEYASAYWVALVGWAVSCGVLDVLLMAAFGAVGGLLWWRISGKNAGPSTPTFAA